MLQAVAIYLFYLFILSLMTAQVRCNAYINPAKGIQA